VVNSYVVFVRLYSDDLVFLETPPSLAPVMGKYQPARFARHNGKGGYVVREGLLDQAERFLKANGAVVTDQRKAGQAATPRRRAFAALPECAACRMAHPIAYAGKRCAYCGEPWTPTYPELH
jgi:hypothetical protein